MRATQVLILCLLLVACGSQQQNAKNTPSTDDFWEAREDQSVIFLDRNGDAILNSEPQLQFELLDGDNYCQWLAPQTTCISLSETSEAEAQQRAVYYEEQLKNQGWSQLPTGNQYVRDITNQCRAIVALGAAITPSGSIDWSELRFIQNISCREGGQ